MAHNKLRHKRMLKLIVTLKTGKLGMRCLSRRQHLLRDPRTLKPSENLSDQNGNDQHASGAAILKPAVLTAVDLHQLAKMIVTQTQLMKLTQLLARQPEPVLPHPCAQRLPRDH